VVNLFTLCWISLIISVIVFYLVVLIENLFEKQYKEVLAGKEHCKSIGTGIVYV